MNGFNNYNAYTSYLTPQSNGYSPSAYMQNQLGIPSAQQLLNPQQMMQQPALQPMQQQAPPVQQFFAQPSGQLFSINNANELQTIPVQEGAISAIINPNENMLYLKTLQNGKPVVLDYQLKSAELTQHEPVVAPVPIKEEIVEQQVLPSDTGEMQLLRDQVYNLNETISTMASRIEELEKANQPIASKKINTKKEGVE